LKSYYLDHYIPQTMDNSATISAPLMTSPATIDFFNAYAAPEDMSPTVGFDEFTKLRPLGFEKHVPLPL
jgi:hypothetical protein